MRYIPLFLGMAFAFACGSATDQANDSSATTDKFITIGENKDTQIRVIKTDSLHQQTIVEEIHSYKKAAQQAEPTIQVSEKTAYLSLPHSTPTTYKNVSNLIIENVQFTNPSGNNLVLINCTNVIIRNCYFGKSKEEAISIEKGSNITIEKNLFANNKSCVYSYNTTGGIVIRNNQFINVKGPHPRAQYVQFNSCTGGGNVIENNKGECWPGESNPEDLISIFKSKGTPESPILIRNNIFRGGGPSESGGGIMTGDNGGGNIIVENNILVDPGQYGIAASGGSNIIIRNNKIFARPQKFTNVGIYAWAQAGADCNDIEIANNNINYTSGKNGEVEINNLFIEKNCGTVRGVESNRFTLSLEELQLPARLIDFVSAEELLLIRGKK
ncbi:right-handed parallel beta-helix repeat-containing protein [Terrimonas pollutisoli]|uniref:right-handed parallel beta-helix repeat-containing protein n=1 Tax=Terrimonas pollutisoli TaxID=3034147 RepID=UPI0023EDF4AA|nr:right-handed parallel beta-helix repeat-containing protein [Terrimonas sp. H1YJ31]